MLEEKLEQVHIRSRTTMRDPVEDLDMEKIANALVYNLGGRPLFWILCFLNQEEDSKFIFE